MTLQEFVGLNHLTTDHHIYYHTAIKKLGGTAAIRPYIPFTDEVLQKSYAKDRHFNTNLTPIRQWDNATGIFTGYRKSIPPCAVGGGLLQFLIFHDITSVSQAECVCILKQAAKEIVDALSAWLSLLLTYFSKYDNQPVAKNRLVNFFGNWQGHFSGRRQRHRVSPEAKGRAEA